MRNNHRQAPGLEAHVFGVERHRIATDGKGITTLVAFHSCPLKCTYCLNPQCHDSKAATRIYTPESLYKQLKVDDLYFRATEGGVTFGGGEPALYPEFITRFRHLCGNDWKITLETSLNVERANIYELAGAVDEWIVDIKAFRPNTYSTYTKGELKTVLGNLKALTTLFGVDKNRITIRIPIIPKMVDRFEALRTKKVLQRFGFTKFDIFEYQTQRQKTHYSLINGMEPGKALCKILKVIRRDIAGQHNIEIQEQICSQQGDCQGTCPQCDQELSYLTEALMHKRMVRPILSKDLAEMIEGLYIRNQNNENAQEGLSSETIVPKINGNIICAPPEDKHPLNGKIVKSVHAKKLLKECAIAGVSYHLKPDDELWNELEEGKELALVRHRNNKYDKNAVAVALACDYDGDADNFDFDFILGYIPKDQNAEIATLIDMGWEDSLSATLSTVSHTGNYNQRLRISIFLESKEPMKPHYDGLRFITLSPDEMKELQAELSDKGLVYRKWRKLPAWEYDLPRKGENVVAYSHNKDNDNDIDAYLLKVVATGEECSLLSDESQTEHCNDDCEGFLLSNISGPLSFSISHKDGITLRCRKYEITDIPDEAQVELISVFFETPMRIVKKR